MYESIRRTLNSYYFGELPARAEALRQTVFSKMDEYDRENPGSDSYTLKGVLYECIAENVEPVIFPEIPFYFETGALVAFSDGRYDRGAVHANGWLNIRNLHVFSDADPEAYEMYVKDKRECLYAQCGPYVDLMHIGLPLKKVFKIGLSGIAEELSMAISEEKSEKSLKFLRTALSGINALHKIELKMADKASELGLDHLADLARRVPWQAPRTLHEGLALMAFMRKALGSIEGVGFNSFGRADLLLGPLYESDLENGLTEKEALTLIEKFILIWDSTLDRSKKLESSYSYEMENTLTLGGSDEEGNHVFNGVTRLFLQARENLSALYPKMMLRYSKSSPVEYVKLISAPLLMGKSYSLFENDDAVIPALIASGIEKSDAVNYCIGGCWDALTPDVATRFCGEYLNTLRPLEWSIHGCKEDMENHALYFESLENKESFEEIYESYLGFVKQLLWRKVASYVKYSRLWEKVSPTPTLSALMSGCIERRTDLTAGGGKYNRECVYFSCFADSVDSLLAIKTLCFEEKICTVKELFAECRTNWKNENLHRLAISAPSFGDGSEESSRFAARLFDDLYAMSQELPTTYGGKFRVGYNQYTEVIWWGKQTKATPSGRRNGEYLSQGLSPARLQNTTSPLSVIESLRYINLEKCAANSSLTLTLPSANMTEDIMSAFFFGAAKSGVQALQPNCVSKQTLLKAQKEPENYGHIIVRVCGFSAPFVLLSPEYQNEFITRLFTE